ncbi:helix-turn-helix domain-containing protein [Streptomyces albospinus]|uniref:helix-turn-helix domain-containing protein n=1 Tax=Streptomyces albospinus TaxID=285515 RepID=UPI00227D9517|nr:helix-turn-helix transcriptional regulator [Streptomyces albospinus]
MESCSWGRVVSESVHVLAARLVAAEHQHLPIDVLLEHATDLGREVGYYTAAAVHDARADGASWEAVAAAAGVSVETARDRWGERKVKRLLTRRAQEQCPCRSHQNSARRHGFAEAVPPEPEATAGAGSAVGGSHKLASALSYLQRKSGMTITDAAQQADLSPSYVSRVLAGDRVPSWAVVHMLATIFGGQASELRMLWESTQGGAHPPRQTVKGAAQRLQDAFRGLYLAAFCPDLEDVTIEGQVSAATVTEVLRGNVVPDWETTGALVAKLGGHPGDFRRLWEEFHYAFLASQVHFPPDGLSRWVLPGSDPDAGGSSA